MQDITPPHRRPRGHIKPGQRPAGLEMRPPTVYREIYSRTRIINSTTVYVSEPEKEASTTETSTRAPLPLSLQFELENLLADDSETTTVDETQVIERPMLTPEKEVILQRVRKIIREEQKRAKFRGLFSKHNVVTGMAILFISTTGYVTVDTWITNNTVKAEASELAGSDSDSADGTNQVVTRDQEGTDETKPTQATFGNYIVGPTLPRMLYIDKLNIATRVLPMSVNADGSIQAPRNIYDAGWYNGSVKPGEIGAMFVDGHASGSTREGIFASIDKLSNGDRIQIGKGDGSKLTYQVVHVETVDLEAVDMRKALLPYGNVLRGLNLMTCSGKWTDERQTFDQRTIVYTEQI